MSAAAGSVPWRTRIRRFESALTLSFASSFAIQATNAVSGIVLARALGPLGRGQLAAAILWPMVFAAVGSLGIPESATFHAAHGRFAPRTVLGTSLVLAGLQSVALLGIGVLVIPLVLHAQSHAVVLDSLLYLAYIPFHLVTLYGMGVLNGVHRYRSYQTIRFLFVAITTFPLIPLAVLSDLTPRNVIVLYLAGIVVTATATLVALARAGVGRPHAERACLRALSAYGLKSHTSGVPALLNERLDQLLISIFLTPVRLGLYVVAVTMTSITGLITSSVTIVVLPAIARLEDETDRLRAAVRYLRITLLGGLLVTVPVILLAGPLIRLLFGPGFLPATTVTRVLLVAAVVLAVGRVLGSILKAVNRPLQAGMSELAALGVTVAALAVLLPWLGILGAGIASLAAYSVAAAWNLRAAARALGTTPLALFGLRHDGAR